MEDSVEWVAAFVVCWAMEKEPEMHFFGLHFGKLWIGFAVGVV